MMPLVSYLVTAAFLSFTLAALVGYPSAAILSKPGFAPNDQLWGVITIALGVALTAYSAINKPRILVRFNWLALPIMSGLFFFLCRSFNPESIDGNVGMVLYLAIFTFGAPLWLPLIALLLHIIACNNIVE